MQKTKPITSPILRNSWSVKLLTGFVISIFLILSLIFINPISEFDNIINLDFGVDMWLEFAWFLTIGCLIMIFSTLISRIMDRFIPWESSARRRFGVQLTLMCVTVISILTIFIFLTDALLAHNGEQFDEDSVGFRQILFISIVLSIVVTTIHSGDYLIQRWKDSIMETASLKQVVLESQLQSLKLQLDPHFLFNNFSTLSSLISEDRVKAQDFLDSLSQVHRYMLFNLDRHVVSIREEIIFIKHYIHLIKIRFGDNLQISLAQIHDLDSKGIPPIALQILIENAVKHNISTKLRPLHIRIAIAAGYLEVSNNLQKLPSAPYSSKIGLRNIRERYALISSKIPVIVITETEFVVKLPLLDLTY